MNDEKRGRFLQQIRKEKGLTQQELGDLIHYTDKAISKWERGQSFPKDPEVLENIAMVFNLSIAELLYGEQRNSRNDKEMSDHFMGLYKKNYHKYIKLLYATFTMVLISIIFIMLTIYFTLIKGKITSYSLYGENDNFIFSNSSLLLTNKVDILNLTEVEIINDDITSDDINYIKLYYIKDNKEQMVMKGANESYYIEEPEGYNEYNLENIIKYDTYIEICYKDNIIEKIKIDFTEKFINDKVVGKKYTEVGDYGNLNENNNYIEFLISEGFVSKESGYERSTDDVVIYYIEPTNFLIQSDKDGVIESLSVRIGYDDVIYKMIDLNGETETIIYSLEEIDTNTEKNIFVKNNVLYLKYLITNYS